MRNDVAPAKRRTAKLVGHLLKRRRIISCPETVQIVGVSTVELPMLQAVSKRIDLLLDLISHPSLDIDIPSHMKEHTVVILTLATRCPGSAGENEALQRLLQRRWKPTGN